MRLYLLLYNLFIRLYRVALSLAAPFHPKAAQWVAGRKGLFSFLEENISPTDSIVWVHCSSAGEFEQGKPLMEAIKKIYPEKKMLVTFFSPSGYNVAKTYPHADFVTYLPLDTRQNAERFWQLTHPELAIFVKYEFWYHHLSRAAFHHVPLLLISAVFRKNQVFFSRRGRFFRQMLQSFRHLFVQDAASLQLLQQHNICHSSTSGDTRFDRVASIADHAGTVPHLAEFIAGAPVLVAGSTWPGDEEALAALLQSSPNVKLVIAPHEVDAAHIASLQRLFGKAALYSTLQTDGGNHSAANGSQVLIIDSVGLLSRLYRYATVTYVGGGFTKDGIHNILEPAAWGKPVIFGPNYQKYREGAELMAAGGAFSFATPAELKTLADGLFNDEQRLQAASRNAKNYIIENTGATSRILGWIQEKRLLTN